MKIKHIYLAVAALILICISLYIGGLLSQVLDNYQQWQAVGGMAGNATIASTNFDARHCLQFAFTIKGLSISFTVLTIICGIILFFMLRGQRPGSEDGRNFKRSKKGTYGTAAWMDNKEMKEVLNQSKIADTSQIILGKKNGKVLTLRRDSMLNKHTMVTGSTGSGKSVCYVRPFALQCIRRGESIILTDPKAELYEDLAQIFLDNGYEVRVFNTIDPSLSDSWNCMDDINGDEFAAQTLTSIIMDNTLDEDRPDMFWKNNEENLLKALVLYVDGLSEEERSLSVLYQTLTNNNASQLVQLFERLPQGHPARSPASYFIKAEPTVQAGTINGLGIRLQVLQSKAIQGITSGAGIDLSLPAKKKCAYFVLLSDQESSLNFLTSLFFRFLFRELVRYADSTEEKKCDISTNICLDEFCNIGTLGTDYARQLNTIRSRDISVSMIIQSLPQLQNRYPDGIWQELISACDTQLLLGCTDRETAEYYSIRSGDITVEVESTMVNKKTMSVMQTIPQYRESSGVGKRKLMTIDELMRMPNEKLLISIRGHNVLMADKFMYKEHPMSRKMEKSNIFDYQPLIKTGYVVEEQVEIHEEEPQTKAAIYDRLIKPDDF